MEGALTNIDSAELKTPKIQSILKNLIKVVDEAKDIRNTVNFQNSSLRRGLTIVEEYIKSKKRICYGGMAVNAHLPAEYQFYDFSKNLPDYDFFTPDPEKDIETILYLLEKENLPYVEAKLGIHKGTVKIFVDFNAVADITEVSKSFYTILQSKAYTYKNIKYADANFLRMSMYIELSRPMGEVERWDKVYSRLLLFNQHVPFLTKNCKKTALSKLSNIQRSTLMNYCSEQYLVYAGGDLEQVYNSDMEGFDSSHYPLIAYSSNIIGDIQTLKSILESLPDSGKLRIYRWSPVDEFIPFLLGLVQNGKIIAVLVEISACHSYNTILIHNNKMLRIASLDSLIALYFSLSYVKGLESSIKTSYSCLANRLSMLSNTTRDNGKTGKFDAFPLTCTGHQPSKESLMVAKRLRVKEYKDRKSKQTKTKKKTR